MAIAAGRHLPHGRDGPIGTAVRISLAAEGVEGERLHEIAGWGWRHCPVDDAMRRAVTVSIEVDVER